MVSIFDLTLFYLTHDALTRSDLIRRKLDFDQASLKAASRWNEKKNVPPLCEAAKS